MLTPAHSKGQSERRNERRGWKRLSSVLPNIKPQSGQGAHHAAATEPWEPDTFKDRSCWKLKLEEGLCAAPGNAARCPAARAGAVSSAMDLSSFADPVWKQNQESPWANCRPQQAWQPEFLQPSAKASRKQRSHSGSFCHSSDTGVVLTWFWLQRVPWLWTCPWQKHQLQREGSATAGSH